MRASLLIALLLIITACGDSSNDDVRVDDSNQPVPEGGDNEGTPGGDARPVDPERPPTDGEEPTPCWALTWALPTEYEPYVNVDGDYIAATPLDSAEIQSVFVFQQDSARSAVLDWPAIVEQGDLRITQLDGTRTSYSCVDPRNYFSLAVLDVYGEFSDLSEEYHQD